MEELVNIIKESFEVNIVTSGKFKGSYVIKTAMDETWYLYKEDNKYMFVKDDPYDFINLIETTELQGAKYILQEFTDYEGVYEEIRYNENTRAWKTFYNILLRKITGL